MSSSSSGISIGRECHILSYLSGHVGCHVDSKYRGDNGNLFRVTVFVAGLPSYVIKQVLPHPNVLTHFTIRTYDSMLPAALKTCLELMGLRTVTNKEMREESDAPAF
jgi:hypothetical protein